MLFEHNLFIIYLMSSLNHIKDKIRGRGIRVIFADGADVRLPKAIRILLDEALIKPVVVINSKNSNLINHYPSEAEIIDCSDHKQAEKWAKKIAAIDPNREIGRTIRDFENPLFAASTILAAGGADAIVAGLIDTTRDVIRAMLHQVGLAKGRNLASSYFLLDLSNNSKRPGLMAVADCGMVIDPTAEQLAQIALDTAKSTTILLDWTPKVAMLSFSTLGSAESPATQKVVQATEIIKIKQPRLNVVGEIQFDAAINPEIAKTKLPEDAPIKGDANIFIFPNLDAGNIGYKIIEQLTGAHAYGPVLQGFAKSASDMSRGSTVEDIVGAASIAAADSLKNR